MSVIDFSTGRELDRIKAPATNGAPARLLAPSRRKRGTVPAEILDMLAAGTSARDIALRLDVTQRYVEYLAKVGGRRQSQGNLLDIC